jgi:hypothetical protein
MTSLSQQATLPDGLGTQYEHGTVHEARLSVSEFLLLCWIGPSVDEAATPFTSLCLAPNHLLEVASSGMQSAISYSSKNFLPLVRVVEQQRCLGLRG